MALPNYKFTSIYGRESNKHIVPLTGCDSEFIGHETIQGIRIRRPPGEECFGE